MATLQTLIGTTIVAPLIGSIAILLFSSNILFRNFCIVFTPFVTLVSAFLLAFHYSALATPPDAFTLFTLAPGLDISFMVEPVGIFFACLVALLWPLSMLYAVTYMYENKLGDKARFCAYFTISIGCTFGIAFAGDLLCLLIFYETLTLSTYPLVIYKKTEKAIRAGRIYIGMLAGTSILLLLPAIIWIWMTEGHLQFTLGGMLSDTPPWWLLVLLVLGVGKIALVPLHRWLPAAMVAPPPVSALLHAVAVVKAGVFTVAKILIYVIGLDRVNSDWLVYLAGISILTASVIALRQDNLKARLAYSTIGHLGYITMGLALLKPALLGALLHFLTHALGKITLFFAAGAIETTSGKKQVSELDGIGYQMPWTMICVMVAAIALIGLPPTFGFWSKWYLLSGAMQTEHYFALAVLIIGTLLSVAYLVPIIVRAFSHKSSNSTRTEISAESVGLVIPMLVPATLLLLLFLFPEWVMTLVERISQ